MELFDNFFAPGEPCIITVIGTGASLTPTQVAMAKMRKTIACNRAYEFGCDVMHACNYQFWDLYHDDTEKYHCTKWTTRPESAAKYPDVNYIEERWAPGLSTDQSYVHAHHGTGPQAVNLALHYGAKKIILIGFDMRFPGKAGGSNRQYLKDRHYFGEYPEELQHWPRTGADGELAGLIKEMETIHPGEYGIDIVNCTPGSALTHFRMGDLVNEIGDG